MQDLSTAGAVPETLAELRTNRSEGTAVKQNRILEHSKTDYWNTAIQNTRTDNTAAFYPANKKKLA